MNTAVEKHTQPIDPLKFFFGKMAVSAYPEFPVSCCSFRAPVEPESGKILHWRRDLRYHHPLDHVNGAEHPMFAGLVPVREATLEILEAERILPAGDSERRSEDQGRGAIPLQALQNSIRGQPRQLQSGQRFMSIRNNT